MEKSYKQYLAQINTLIFDVDGVLTNGLVTVMSNGELIRQMNIKDGYALRSAVNAGLRVCIITGGKNEGVKIRLQNLGIKDVYMGAHDKIEQYNQLVEQISNYISDKKGGEGCVRDIIEQILRVQGKWDSNFDATFD